MEHMNLNLIPSENGNPVCHSKQYDIGRVIRVNLFYGKRAYILSDEYIELDIRKGDNHIVTVELAVESGSRYVDIVTTEQMTAIADSNLGELKVIKNDTVIHSANFELLVQRSPMENGIESDSELQNLTTQVKQIVVNELREHGAEDTGYDPTASGLEAMNVQDAIDEVNSKIHEAGDTYTKAETNALLAEKADITYVDGQFSAVAEDVTNIETALSNKADKSNTYTKSAIDTALSNKADVSDLPDMTDYYTKTEINGMLILDVTNIGV